MEELMHVKNLMKSLIGSIHFNMGLEMDGHKDVMPVQDTDVIPVAFWVLIMRNIERLVSAKCIKLFLEVDKNEEKKKTLSTQVKIEHEDALIAAIQKARDAGVLVHPSAQMTYDSLLANI